MEVGGRWEGTAKVVVVNKMSEGVVSNQWYNGKCVGRSGEGTLVQEW